MATRVFLWALIALLLYAHVSFAIYEDQVGLYDWHQQYIGKVKHAVFHTQKAGRKRVVVSTVENVIASLDLRRGAIFWRHVLGANDPVDQIDIGLGKYVITLSSEGGTVRAWNLPDGQMVWESVLPASAPSKPLLCVPATVRVGKDNLIIVSGGGYLHAISAFDGEVIWSQDFSVKSVVIQEIYQPPEDDIIYILGYSGSSKIVTYEISAKKGEVLKQTDLLFPGRLSGETLHVSNDVFVALDDSKSILILISLKKGEASFHKTHISDLIKDFSGKANLLPSKYTDMFAVKLASCIVLVKTKGDNTLMVVERITHSASLSDALSLSDEQRAFAIVQQKESHVSITVKFDSELDEVHTESIEMDSQRGLVQKVFINNYLRTDRSHGFRALLVMEDHSLLLVQQGEIVWSREDGLASIIDSTTSELPLEKGVSVAKVENNLYEWLKGHLLKLKATLMLANPDDLEAIQDMRLKNSERNKMSRDHNGFRKLLVVLTKAGKVLALHTGDGRIVWSLLPSSFRSESCQNPTGLSMYQWQIPHHLAMDENPSILVIGGCGPNPDAAGILFVVDSYSGKELRSLQLPHSVVQVMPLPFTDSKEQRLHLIFDSNNCAHLYPRTPDSLSVFHRELSNIYWYSVESGKGIMQGHSLHGRCNLDVTDEYCFKIRRLWSIVFPLESEKIVTTTARKSNEVVHTQAKTVGDQDVMYKYISKNLVFVATVSPKVAGDIGSTPPEESHLVVYIIDTVTGRIIHRVTHQGATCPVHAVFSENWVVYHYFNLRAHRHEMSVIEIYDQSRADNKDVLKLMFGKHNLSSPVSSYSWPEIVVKSQSYFFSHSVKAMAVTMTAKGITSKQLLIGTIGDQILALDKRYLDPRRTANPSQSEREEGIIPLTDSLPIIPQSYVTHSLRVEGLRSIVSIPAKLESTTLVFSYGIDLFFTRIAPSRTYDSLTEDFNYALLLITIVALVAAIFVTWVLSEQKELREKWK